MDNQMNLELPKAGDNEGSYVCVAMEPWLE